MGKLTVTPYKKALAFDFVLEVGDSKYIRRAATWNEALSYWIMRDLLGNFSLRAIGWLLDVNPGFSKQGINITTDANYTVYRLKVVDNE